MPRIEDLLHRVKNDKLMPLPPKFNISIPPDPNKGTKHHLRRHLFSHQDVTSSEEWTLTCHQPRAHSRN